MTKHDILCMALDCGASIKSDCEGNGAFGDGIDLLKFADLAEAYGASAEREEFKQVYRCKIKSRKQIDREIPREQQGWWADVAAGQKLLLRQAVQSDLDRCTLGDKRSKNQDDYMCETHTNGSLVSKVALEYMNPEQNVFAAIRARGQG